MPRVILILLAVCVSLTLASFIPQSQAGLECITCVATVKGVEAKVLGKGEDVAEKEVKQICLEVVPMKSAEHLCEEYGDKEVEVMVDLIKKDVPPKEICQKLGKC
ncbi:unnamed protein product [Caenorhabditis angaria]|uniref:Saposin B-type domain-containing protein n=1 Tax=Caenorhabditis angaria TaxID=860376 RepID=A0A9P1I9Q2_9PELO|nr:unnamed protein product [Caenorhabditis angaria]